MMKKPMAKKAMPAKKGAAKSAMPMMMKGGMAKYMTGGSIRKPVSGSMGMDHMDPSKKKAASGPVKISTPSPVQNTMRKGGKSMMMRKGGKSK